jgi:hypothetical protein
VSPCSARGVRWRDLGKLGRTVTAGGSQLQRHAAGGPGHSGHTCPLQNQASQLNVCTVLSPFFRFRDPMAGTPCVRTDFVHGAEWEQASQELVEPTPIDAFVARLAFIDDARYDGLSPPAVAALLRADGHDESLAFIVDANSLQGPDGSVLCIQLRRFAADANGQVNEVHDLVPRSFRVARRSVQVVENSTLW